MKLRAAVLVMSDSVAARKKEDTSGKIIVERLKELNIDVADYAIIPDNSKQIQEKLLHYADSLKLDTWSRPEERGSARVTLPLKR